MAKKKNPYIDMYTLRADGRYQGYYRDLEGKRHSVCDKDPEKLYQKIQSKLDALEHPVEKLITVKDVADEWERVHREEIGERTWKNYKPHYDHLIDQYGDLLPEELTAVIVTAELQRAKAQGRSMTICRTIRSLYSMIMDFAVVQGYVAYNPIASVKLPKGLPHSKRTAPTEEQMKIIVQNRDTEDGFFAFFLLCTGCRKSEALALTWDDIDYKHNRIHITKSIDYINGSNPQIKPPKTEAGNRDIAIPPFLVKSLKAYQAKSTDEHLFPNPPSNRGGAGGGLMHDRAYDGMWKRYCQRTGLEGLTAHQIRHGTATLLYKGKVEIKESQSILGHANSQTTLEIYTDIGQAQLTSAANTLSGEIAKLIAKPKKSQK